MRLIDADQMATDEFEDYMSAQEKTNNTITQQINRRVHQKIQMLIADTPTVEEAVVPIRCKDCKWWNKAGCAIREDKPTESDFCSFGEPR